MNSQNNVDVFSSQNCETNIPDVALQCILVELEYNPPCKLVKIERK